MSIVFHVIFLYSLFMSYRMLHQVVSERGFALGDTNTGGLTHRCLRQRQRTRRALF
ncbi:hypothetical protein [Nitrospira sp. M1]